MTTKNMEQLLKRLHSETVINPITDCWLFNGCLTTKGYGSVGYLGQSFLVHRLSAHIHFNMNLWSNIQVLHKPICPNKNCWNPEHLYLGTNTDNAQDTVKTGNAFNPTAELNKAKTHCKWGHPLEGDNLYIPKDGRRRCQICRRKNNEKYEQDKMWYKGQRMKNPLA